MSIVTNTPRRPIGWKALNYLAQVAVCSPVGVLATLALNAANAPGAPLTPAWATLALITLFSLFAWAFGAGIAHAANPWFEMRDGSPIELAKGLYFSPPSGCCRRRLSGPSP